MKKILALVFICIFTLTCLVACGGGKGEGATLGLGYIVSQKGSDATSEKNGSAGADITVAGVILDKDGKIVSVKIDTIQSSISFDTDGVITNKTAEVLTKKEQGNDYGMKIASSIQKEWFEQIAFLESYLVGKTKSEVSGIAVDAATKPTDSALTSGCTVMIGDVKAAVVKACEDAARDGAKECSTTDKLGIAITAAYGSSKDATSEMAGAATSAVNFAVSAVANGKVTALIADAFDIKRSVSDAGVLGAAPTVTSKRDSGNDYNMKGASSIQKEWFEQIAALEGYMVGKTATEISDIAVNASGKPTDSALTSGCTVAISDLKTVAAKAVTNAK